MSHGRAGAAGVLVACFVCQMGLGCGYVFAATLKHIVAEFEWSRAAFAAASAPLLLAMGVSAPLLGSLSERIGARTVVAATVLVLGASLVVLSRMDSLAEFYLGSLLLGIGMTGVGDVVIGSLASRWVADARGLALAFVFTGSNAGGAVVPLLADGIAARSDWRDALAVVAAAAVVLLLPAALALREPRAPVLSAGPSTSSRALAGHDLDLAQALRTRSFWILAGVLFVFYFYYLAVNQHLIAFVSDLGYSDGRAAASLSFAVFLGIGAKLAMGVAADRFSKKRALLVNFAVLCGASLLLLGASSPPLLVAFLVAHGFAVAAENVILPLVVAECFGVTHLARIYGALMVTLFPGGVLGPIFAGAVFDRFGSYGVAFAVFAALNVAGWLALLGVRPERPGPPLAAAQE